MFHCLYIPSCIISLQRDNHLPSLSLPVDVKPVSGQMCIGDMLQQLQANQPLGIGKLPALSLPSLLKGDSSFTKRDDFSTATGGGTMPYMYVVLE